jgi:hypothetical protein
MIAGMYLALKGDIMGEAMKRAAENECRGLVARGEIEEKYIRRNLLSIKHRECQLSMRRAGWGTNRMRDVLQREASSRETHQIVGHFLERENSSMTA